MVKPWNLILSRVVWKAFDKSNMGIIRNCSLFLSYFFFINYLQVNLFIWYSQNQSCSKVFLFPILLTLMLLLHYNKFLFYFLKLWKIRNKDQKGGKKWVHLQSSTAVIISLFCFLGQISKKVMRQKFLQWFYLMFLWVFWSTRVLAAQLLETFLAFIQLVLKQASISLHPSATKTWLLETCSSFKHLLGLGYPKSLLTKINYYILECALELYTSE